MLDEWYPCLHCPFKPSISDTNSSSLSEKGFRMIVDTDGLLIVAKDETLETPHPDCWPHSTTIAIHPVPHYAHPYFVGFIFWAFIVLFFVVILYTMVILLLVNRGISA